MKGMYGFQIAERLKRSPETASIPIFALTGYFTRKEDAQLMDLCGIEMCFEKPFNPANLISKIEAFIEQYNKNPNPFKWVKDAQEIISKAKKPAYAI